MCLKKINNKTNDKLNWLHSRKSDNLDQSLIVIEVKFGILKQEETVKAGA